MNGALVTSWTAGREKERLIPVASLGFGDPGVALRAGVGWLCAENEQGTEGRDQGELALSRSTIGGLRRRAVDKIGGAARG